MAEEDYPYTGPSWTSIYTGMSAEEHGVTDLWGRNVEGSESYDTLRDPVIWEMLNHAEMTTGVVHMPMTTCSRQVKGYIISGFPNDLEHAGAGAELFPLLQSRDISDLIRLTPRDRILDNTWYRNYTFEQSVEIMKKMVQWKAETVRMLVRTHPVDCLFVQYSMLDRIGHLLNQYLRLRDGKGWSYEPVLELYDWLDEMLGNLLDVGEEYDLLVITSDHGWPAEASEPYTSDGKLFGAWHSHDGVLITSDFSDGGRVEPGRGEQCYNRDVSPIVLHLLGEDYEELRSATNPLPQERHRGASNEAEQTIEERLRALGYL
jgi:predicted AlkP superfamily phosphohydrolase/phosphomutase